MPSLKINRAGGNCFLLLTMTVNTSYQTTGMCKPLGCANHWDVLLFFFYCLMSKSRLSPFLVALAARSDHLVGLEAANQVVVDEVVFHKGLKVPIVEKGQRAELVRRHAEACACLLSMREIFKAKRGWPLRSDIRDIRDTRLLDIIGILELLDLGPELAGVVALRNCGAARRHVFGVDSFVLDT